MLINRTTLGGTDPVLFLSSPLGHAGACRCLEGGHWQTRDDLDDDGWADVAGYGRGIARPRLFWDGGGGRTAFLTAGVTYENRDGGTMSGATLAATGLPYQETLDTRRYDVGGTVQTLWKNRYVVAARAAAAWQRQDHRFGDVLAQIGTTRLSPRSRREVRQAVRRGLEAWPTSGTRSIHATCLDLPTSTTLPRFRHRTTSTGSWLSLSASARVDFHSEDNGTFFSPRIAALFRKDGWTSRIPRRRKASSPRRP